MLTYIHTLNGERSEGEGGEKGCVQKKGRVREGVMWGQPNVLKKTELTLCKLPPVIEPVCSSTVQLL